MDDTQKQQFAAALAAFDELSSKGFPSELANELAAVRESLVKVVQAASKIKKGLWSWFAAVFTGIYEIVDVFSGDVSVSERPSAGLKKSLGELSEKAQALKSAMASLPDFRATHAECADKLAPFPAAEAEGHAGELANYLNCVATSMDRLMAR